MATTAPPTNALESAFPNSRKVYVLGPDGMRVPMREISLSGGEPPLRVYDTSGPGQQDVHQGLPTPRLEWIRERHVSEVAEPASPTEGIPAGLTRPVLRGSGQLTQLYYARCGEITPEMEFIALRCGPKSRTGEPSSRPTSTTQNSSR
jgi:phosphomethylpyrimidine synthase